MSAARRKGRRHSRRADNMTPWVTAEYVLYRLDRAGETLMALPSRGCFPSGYRSAMPDYLQLPDEDAESSHRLNPLLSATNTDRPRPPVPGRQDVTEMDQVYLEWLPLLPSATEVERQTRRIVQLRTLVWPGSERKDPHVWSWRALGEMFGIDGKTVSARHALAVDRLVSRVNRPSTRAVRRDARQDQGVPAGGREQPAERRGRHCKRGHPSQASALC